MSIRKNPIAYLALFVALGGASYAATHGSLPSPGRVGDGGLAQAHTLPGDQLLAGPVLVDHRAVWVEAGHRLLVRSLDANGRTRTIFSTSATPGAPKGTIWPFYVDNLAAGGGRVAFLEKICPCASAPPRAKRCTPTTEGAYPDSVTLFAGRSDAIKPVESFVHPRAGICGRPQPLEVGVADAGLVVYEGSVVPCTGGVSRLVLRTFSGGLVRVLAQGLPVVTPFVAAGSWAAFITHPSVLGEPDQLQIIRVTTGQVVLKLSQQGLDEVAVDSSGRFALMTYPGVPAQCEPRGGFDELSAGEIGHPGMQVVASRVLGLEEGMSIDVAIAGDRVAYGQPTGPCLTSKQVVIGTPGAVPTPIPGLKLNVPLAFDGRMVATAQGHALQLATTRG